MRNIFRITVLILLASVFVIVLIKNRRTVQFEVDNAKIRVDSIPVHAVLLQPGPAEVQIETVGKVKSMEEVYVISQAAGEIREVSVKIGERVKRGDVIASIDDFYARQEYHMARLACEQLKKDFARYADLSGVQAVTLQQLEQLRLQVEGAEAKMVSLERRLNDFVVKSTVEGVVNQIFVSKGNMTGAGTPVAEIVGDAAVKIEARINPEQAEGLVTGTRATVTANFGHGEKYSASLAELGKKAGKFGGVSALFYLEPGATALPATGSMVTIRLGVKGVPGLLLPRKALTTFEGQMGIFVLKDDLTAHFTQVAWHDFDDTRVAVQDSLLAGKMVVTDGNFLLKNGDRVKIVAE